MGLGLGAGLEHWCRRQPHRAAFESCYRNRRKSAKFTKEHYLILRMLSLNLCLLLLVWIMVAAASSYHIWQLGCRSAEMRDTEGGASKRSVLQQVEKLKTYLSAEVI